MLHKVTVDLTDRELEMLRRKASALRVTMAEALLICIQRATRKVRVPPKHKARLR